jgi:hypothetical protein
VKLFESILYHPIDVEIISPISDWKIIMCVISDVDPVMSVPSGKDVGTS